MLMPGSSPDVALSGKRASETQHFGSPTRTGFELSECAHRGHSKTTLHARPRRSLDDIEEELTIAQRRNHEPVPFKGCIGQIVAPSAERYKLIPRETAR